MQKNQGQKILECPKHISVAYFCEHIEEVLEKTKVENAAMCWWTRMAKRKSLLFR